MAIKIPKAAAKGANHEAHKLAGHPTSTSAIIGAGLVASTGANVASYQVNRKLAMHQGTPPPAMSATTGAGPSTGSNMVGVGNSANRQYRKGVRKTRNKLKHRGGN